MKVKIFRGIAAFLLSIFLFGFSPAASAHNDPASHDVFRGVGNGLRALMHKDGYGRSHFTLYTDVFATVTNESGKSATNKLVAKLGTAFMIRSDGYMLTSAHVVEIEHNKKEYAQKITALYSALSPPQRVSISFTEKYTAVDMNRVSFPVFLVKKSGLIDAAIFRFENGRAQLRKSFLLEDENKSTFSPVVVPGSPLGISNVLGFGHIARTELYECGENKQGYLLFISPINPGNSGGPLYNLETDKVNGMVTAFLKSDANNSISCAVPSSALIPFVNENLPPR